MFSVYIDIYIYHHCAWGWLVNFQSKAISIDKFDYTSLQVVMSFYDAVGSYVMFDNFLHCQQNISKIVSMMFPIIPM